MTLPVRAKRGYIRGKRYDKAGRIVSAQLHPVSGLAGSISGKEMERMMLETADTHGLSAKDIVIETYAAGDAPRESNPSQGDKYERFTRTVASDGYVSNWDRAFGISGKGEAARVSEWTEARPGVARLTKRGKE